MAFKLRPRTETIAPENVRDRALGDLHDLDHVHQAIDVTDANEALGFVLGFWILIEAREAALLAHSEPSHPRAQAVHQAGRQFYTDMNQLGDYLNRVLDGATGAR